MVSTLVAMSTNKGINFICYMNKEFSAITSLFLYLDQNEHLH